MEEHVVSNIVVALIVAALVALAIFVRGNRMWSQAMRALWRRRRVAILVVGLYVLVALLDCVAWVGGLEGGEDAVAQYQAQTLIDRAFSGTRERSYSAPLASVEFYGDAPLERPGTHGLPKSGLDQR